MKPGAIYHLPGLGRGDLIQLHVDRRRDSEGRLYCYSTDPLRHRIYPSEEHRLVAVEVDATDPLPLWTSWRRMLSETRQVA